MNIANLIDAKERFKEKYAKSGVAVGISFECIAVRLESAELGKDLPKEFEGFRVDSLVVGKIIAL